MSGWYSLNCTLDRGKWDEEIGIIKMLEVKTTGSW